MKKWVGCVGAVAALCLMLYACYYTSYKNALKKFNRQAKEQKENYYSQIVKIGEENKALLGKLSKKEQETKQLEEKIRLSETAEVAVVPGNTVLPSVSFTEETFDAATGEFITMSKVAPGFLVGMTRDELSEYLKHYMENLSITEYEAGLQAYEIISFSESNVILRKTYDVTKVPYKYYINISNGMVTVYYSNKESVFEYTHIPAVELSEENRRALMEGIYVKDREELYSLLEGFSS